jgi:hypothetical protein
MEHIAIDLGAKESQLCVPRSSTFSTFFSLRRIDSRITRF